MTLLEHAKRELDALGCKEGEEDPDTWMRRNVLELIEVFSKQKHSGFSALYCINLFTKLARYEPLIPLTGKDSEWFEYIPGKFQNVRCSHVFKDEDGKAYDINAVVFIDEQGGHYTNGFSRRYVEFPYSPTTTYVKDAVAEVAI